MNRKCVILVLAWIALAALMLWMTRPSSAQEARAAPEIPTPRLQVCNPGEQLAVQEGYWATIRCGYMGTSEHPHLHWRDSIRFNSAECSPWVIIWNNDGTATIYCHRVWGQP